MSLLKQSDGIDVVAAQQLWRRLIRLMPDGWLWCAGREADGRRLLRRCSGDLPEGRHTEAGYAVDHAAGDDMSFNFPREQSPSPEAPSDQDLAPVRSFWYGRTFSVLAGRLPTHLRVHCNAATESRSARPGISPDFRTSL
jgi:hypothetical protein